MDLDLAARLERALSRRPVALAPLPGGCVADVRRVDLAGGGRAVAKLASDAAGSTLETEAFMLRYLAERSPLPVPRVLHAEPDLLVLEHVENDGRTGEPTERDAAAHLAALHDLRPDPPHDRDFGFDRPTPIGSLRQPNPWTRSWVAFSATSVCWRGRIRQPTPVGSRPRSAPASTVSPPASTT